MRCRAADELETGGDDVESLAAIFTRCPAMVCLQTMKGDLHHLGAAAGADPVPGLDHLFDAGQMTKIALGRRSLGGAIGIGGA